MTAPALDATSVGIREFRADLAEYIAGDAPITITRHGEVVGVFVPLRRPTPEAVQRLLEANARVRETLGMSDDEVEELMAEFEARRRRDRQAKAA